MYIHNLIVHARYNPRVLHISDYYFNALLQQSIVVTRLLQAGDVKVDLGLAPICDQSLISRIADWPQIGANLGPKGQDQIEH